MNKEFKLHLNASDYAFDHIDSNKTYNSFEVYKMLYDSYIAGNNDTLNDEDEMIKGAIIHFISNTQTVLKGIIDKKTMIAWLKKQGEQKPANTVEPKFHEGDWVVSNLDEKARQISEVHFDEYNSYYVVDGKSVNLEEYDRLHHLWTIQDAKDGDVLATWAGAFIYNGNNGGGSCPGSYCGINTLGRFKTGVEHHWTGKKVYPATKEQRDLLFLKMHEAGYTFDFEKKELKKIEQKPADKVKPKFHEGDWVMLDRPVLITKVEYMPYNTHQYWTSDGTWFGDATKSKLWTIQDAKNGDVLATEDKTLTTPFVAIFKERGLDFFNSYSFIGFDGIFYEGEEGHAIEDIHPATKEQRNLLFLKMKEAGYEWNAEKKELKKIEQKQTDKVKPKFKIGNWVVDKNGTVHQILSYKDCIYKHTNGYSSKIFEDEWRLWDITKDAKDGDVLATDDGNIFVLDGTVKEDKYPFAYCGLTRHKFEIYDRSLPFTHNNIYPATKEQRDLLFQKMKEKGYKWDAEKKELKKIEQKSGNKIKPIFNVGDKIQYSKGCGTIMTIEKIENGEYIFANNMGYTTIENGNKCYLVEKKSGKWTKEDDERLGSCIFCTQSFAVENDIDSANTAWLKSIKQRILKGE